MNRKNIFIRKGLTLETYLIGYKNAGESIIFIVYADDNIKYSGVIDCYEYGSLNKTIEILEDKGVETLDFICWTHPDEDHSIGIDTLIDMYAGEGTKVYLPENIDGQEYGYHERIRNTFDKINETITSRKRKKYSVYSVSDSKTLVSMNFTYGTKGSYKFRISSIAPNSNMLRRNEFNETFRKNDYSIGLLLNIGEFNLLFSGDIENRTIDRMEEYYLPSFIDYIKVPHHGSESSDRLLGYLDYNNKCEVACTTVFRNHKLPKQNIINKYKNYVRSFYSTGKLSSDDIDDYGVINVRCDILNKDMVTTLEGNSEKVYGLV